MSPDPSAFRQAEIAHLAARSDRAERRIRMGAVALALALHAGMAGWMAYRGPTEDLNPPGEMEITVDLAPAALEVESVGAGASAVNAMDAPEAEPVEEFEEVVEAVEPDVTPPTEVAEAEAVEPQVAEIEEVEAIEAPIAEEPEVVVAAPLPKPPPPPAVRRVERKPDPKPVERRRPPPRPQASIAQQAGTSGRTASDVGGRAASASPAEINRYYARVRAVLMRRKRYPSSAGGAHGIATVQFTINRSGGVVSATLARSSGNAALDQAALTMARGGSFPPIPASIPLNQVTLSAPVNFKR